ncbi:hypothetical protein J8F10_08175 [Gemmata sp. G18]|uniref:Serine protease n=1 Tax=Gemmata palustris TaxID=2822762 RepID=A0ABS5BNF6_9BACT|nr:hypothetical protein [Gemmata palustris]MBP3955255.1 hypothetical protein [Gemmata palustris]
MVTNSHVVGPGAEEIEVVIEIRFAIPSEGVKDFLRRAACQPRRSPFVRDIEIVSVSHHPSVMKAAERASVIGGQVTY